MQNISEYTRSQARQAADKEFARLVGTAALHIYTDTCFSLDFILRHASKLRKHHHRVKVTKSVQLELEFKRKQPWALRKQNELRKRSEIFEFLPRSKAERRRFYKQSKSPVYADEDFELRFRDEDESPKVFLTADRKLAQKIAALPSPPDNFSGVSPKTFSAAFFPCYLMERLPEALLMSDGWLDVSWWEKPPVSALRHCKG